MIRLFFILLFVACCIFFAIENPAPVTIDLGFHAGPEMPAGILVLGVGFMSLLLGLLLGWLGEIRQRLRARRAGGRLKAAERDLAQLQAQNRELAGQIEDFEQAAAKYRAELRAAKLSVPAFERPKIHTLHISDEKPGAPGIPDRAPKDDKPKSLKEKFIDRIL